MPDYTKFFVAQMNKTAKQIGLSTLTNFDCPHGMDSQNNFATAADMCLLAK